MEVSPFSTETEFKEGPYLTLVDKCPFVHETAVNVAEKLRHGRPISKRLCKVLEKIQCGKQELAKMLKKVCPNNHKSCPEKNKDYDKDRDIKAHKLLEERMKTKPIPTQEIARTAKRCQASPPSGTRNKTYDK